MVHSKGMFTGLVTSTTTQGGGGGFFEKPGGLFLPTIMWKPLFGMETKPTKKRGCETPRGVFVRRTPNPNPAHTTAPCQTLPAFAHR